MFDKSKDARLPKLVESVVGKILSPVGGHLHCNFDTAKLKISFSVCNHECLDAWSDSSYELIDETIWNNRFLCVDKMSIFRDDMIKLGFRKIGNGIVWPEQNFFLVGLIDSFPAE